MGSPKAKASLIVKAPGLVISKSDAFISSCTLSVYPQTIILCFDTFASSLTFCLSLALRPATTSSVSLSFKLSKIFKVATIPPSPSPPPISSTQGLSPFIPKACRKAFWAGKVTKFISIGIPVTNKLAPEKPFVSISCFMAAVAI